MLLNPCAYSVFYMRLAFLRPIPISSLGDMNPASSSADPFVESFFL